MPGACTKVLHRVPYGGSYFRSRIGRATQKTRLLANNLTSSGGGAFEETLIADSRAALGGIEPELE